MGLLFSVRSSHWETRCWYIRWPSNKRTYEGPNVWRSTERSWTVRLAVTEVNSYKLGNYRSAGYEKEIKELLTSFCQLTNVSQTALSAVTLGQFSKELWRFEWRPGWTLSPKIGIMVERYLGRWYVNFFADYCWCLNQDAVSAKHRRKSLKIPFINE